MEGCPRCGAPRRTVRFDANLVTACTACHALRSDPIVDPRVPSFREHLKCLQEEIQVEEAERDPEKVLRCRVESSAPHVEGAALRVQVMDGDPRWLVSGSRCEGFPDEDRKETDAANVRVGRKAGSILELEVDDRSWADYPSGSMVRLEPRTNATLYRNLLKAFLVAQRIDPDVEDLARPERLPALPEGRSEGDDTGLRPEQARAFHAMWKLPERGVALVQGPPGTGKTTVIARFLSEAARRGDRVLVTSHTHVAIDNALRKALAADGALASAMVRLGEDKNVARDLQHLVRRVGSFHEDPEDPDARPLFRALQDHKIVGMTLDALACALLWADQWDQVVDRFDYVLVDEAGMNAFPKIAVAHAVGKRLVLVGDPLQLPPIIRAWSFRDDADYKRSHFEVLQLLRPDLGVMLDEQFRCDPRIYSWSRDAVYNGRVASRRGAGAPPTKVLGVPVTAPVVWFDTRRLPGNGARRVGSSHINPAHTAAALQIVGDLVAHGMLPEDVGYISPFRAQADAFRAAVESGSEHAGLAAVTASTVDAFQGNERRAIVFDLTTLRPARPHRDHRRLNVSLTRAQDLLVVLGPRPFTPDLKVNPYLWSLERWDAVQVVPFPTWTAMRDVRP